MHIMVLGISLLFLCGVAAIAILGTLFWLWMIVDCATHESSGSNQQIVWLLIIIFTHLIGAILYYFIRRPERIRFTGR
jgi:hypothetical protein